MIKVKVMGHGDYRRLFEEEEGYEVVDGDNFELVCFTGGTDISPSIYGAHYHPRTHPSDHGRDLREVVLYRDCTKRGIPMVGICRGGQLLCALAGGSLYQHVNNHSGSHPIHTPIGEMVVTSSHHQMMDVSRVRSAEVIGWSVPRSTAYETDQGQQKPPRADVEVAYFPTINALAHQPHPEWMDHQAPYRRFFFSTIESYLFQEVS